MAYHPVIFKSISRITADTSPVLFRALQSGMAIYSMHTALDVAIGGTNDVLAEIVGLSDPQPLQPADAKSDCKVVVTCPRDDVEAVASGAFRAGAGQIGEYSHCSFRLPGEGTFFGGAGANPAVGQAGRMERVEEVRLEVTAPADGVDAVRAAITAAHSYETPAIDIYQLRAGPSGRGMGRVGDLPRATKRSTLLGRIKRGLDIKHLLLAGGEQAEPRITRVAVAAGSCGPMWQSAVRGGAELYLTGEMKHHDALAAAAAGLSVVCVGHSNSERVTLARLAERLGAELPDLRVSVSTADRDPFTII
jgi:dinuclear metal center YbgI/SA1388 family protein